METIRLPLQRLDAQLSAEGANRESRTVPMTWYTGARVVQFSWDHGVHNLTLSMEPKHIRMDRLQSGRAPFTRGHADTNDPTATLGVIENARIENGVGRANVRFSKRSDVDPILADIIDGILPNVSVGAKLHRLKEITEDGDKIKSFLATDWEPTAVALVGEGADKNAHFSAGADSECEIEFSRASARKEATMPEVETAGVETRTNQDAVAQAQLAERSRVLEITRLGTKHNCAELAAQHIGSGSTLDVFRAALLDTIAAREPETRSQASVARDATDTFRAGMAQAILSVQGIGNCTQNDPGWDMRGLASRGPLAICERVVRNAGKNPDRMTRDEVIRFALSTSDLPYVLGATADASLRAGYGAVNSSWPKITSRRVVANFRTHNEVNAAITASFPKVPENGEYQVATIAEGKETYQVYTYGQKFIVSRQMLVNDSLGALTDIPMQLGTAAAYSQAKIVWDWIIANGNLSDSAAVFSTTHSNYITPGTAISVDNLGIARKTLALQTNPASQIIGLTPSFMVVPATKEQLARQYLSNAYNPAQSSTINPWAGMAELIVEPRLDGSSTTAWYLFASPNIAPVFVAVYLAGNEGIFSQSETTVDVDGFKWLMRYDFGVGSVDYRGAVMNAGA